jgi:hypothetical protein
MLAGIFDEARVNAFCGPRERDTFGGQEFG